MEFLICFVAGIVCGSTITAVLRGSKRRAPAPQPRTVIRMTLAPRVKS